MRRDQSDGGDVRCDHLPTFDVKLAQINLFSLGGISLYFGKHHHCYMLRHVG